MSELYVKPDISECFSIGKKVAEYGVSEGPSGIHTVDAGLEFIQQAHALLRPHKDEDVPVFSEPASFERVGEMLAEAEASPVAADAVGFNPTLVLIYRAAKMIADLMGWELPFVFDW